jgi:hypothetical protein
VFSDAHGRYSSELDVHNNALGQRIGQQLATQNAAQGVDELTGEAQLRDSVLAAIGDGEAFVMDSIESAPRPSRMADIRTPDRTLRTHVPDAPGFPTPIGDGTVDLTMPFAALGPAQLKLPRDIVPQA